jgi:hypothetical protein
MRRGSAVRSVYGYLLAVLKKYPNQVGYVFPSKHTIQVKTFKWVRWRNNSYKSKSKYSVRQIYRALADLERIGAIAPVSRGWLVHDHRMWTTRSGRICRIRKIENTLTLPKNYPTPTVIVQAYLGERYRGLKETSLPAKGASNMYPPSNGCQSESMPHKVC